MDFDSLRKAYGVFRYEGADITDRGDSFRVVYRFSIPGLCDFAPSWEFPKPQNTGLDGVLSELFLSLGMVELISYWKCACPPEVEVFFPLCEEQKKWWKKLFFNGLGEFFHVNKIDTDISSFMKITSEGEKTACAKGKKPLSGCLVPIGGGKDSAVTLELMKGVTDDISAYIVNPRGAETNTCIRAGIDSVYAVTRNLDRKIIALNAEGYLNGHTPFSAVLAFSSVICAYINGKKHVVLSNESSANEATVASGANHQYSKSYEFERDFRQYESDYISSGVNYFSLLRPLSEYQIGKLFSSYTQYHDIFRSCNVGSKTDSWCGKCPKCLFVSVILSAFLGRDEIKRIFDTDILDDATLSVTLDKLIGDEPEKPFECVGSRAEAFYALKRACERYKDGGEPSLIKYFRSKHGNDEAVGFENYYDTANSLPFPLECRVASSLFGFKNYIKAVFTGKKTAILGYGREGRSTAALFDELSIPYTVVDMRDAGVEGGIYGEDYQSSLDSFDITVKSPGVVLEKDISEYNCAFTSQTELFLAKYRDRSVGITGTKGKSTTTSLIYHALRFNGKDAVIAGNIGVPPLDAARSVGENTVVVLELSSHQLEYTSVSPHTAVYLNLHEEHLDHYGTFEKYRAAKENIYLNQIKGDALVCGFPLAPARDNVTTVGYDCGDVNVGTESVTGFGKSLTVKPESANLVGRHGLDDIAFAWTVCRNYISDGEFLASLGSFVPLAHRLQNIGTYGGVTYYDDSISTIGDTAINAIKSLPLTDTVIIGGMDRGIDYTDLIDFLASADVKHILLIEKSGKRIFETAKEKYPSLSDGRMIYSDTLAEAVETAKKVTAKGKICLLSPAAASYGSFRNFEERGEVFARLVKGE